MQHDVVVTFGIPLIGRSVANDWGRVVHQLNATLASIYAETDPNFRVILVGTDRPELAVPVDHRFEFIAEDQLPAMHAWSGIIDGVRKRRRAARRLRELGGGYLMLTDADDLVSRRLVEFVRSDRHPHGYLVGDGYMFDAGRGLIAPFPFGGPDGPQRFDQECGTSAIPFFAPEDLPSAEDDNDNYYDRLMERGHPGVMAQAIALGRPLRDLPERLVCYVRNTSQNMSAEEAAARDLKRIAFQASLDDGLTRQALIRTPELDAEFGLKAAEALVRTTPAQRQYRPSPGLSVQIATYRRPEGLRRLLTALRPQVAGHPSREIVVVNDGSHDEAYAKVAADFSDIIRYKALETNQGVAAARNASLGLSLGAYSVFTDDDCVPPPWWLDWLSVRLAVHPEVDVVIGTTLPNYARRTLSERIQGFWFLPRPWRFGTREMFVTANVAIRTALIGRLGGFRGFGGAGEDTELCLRLHRGGARFMVDPRWTVDHDVDLRFRSLVAKYRRYGAANAAIAKLTGAALPAPRGSADSQEWKGDTLTEMYRANRIAADRHLEDIGKAGRILAAATATWIHRAYARGFDRGPAAVS